MKIEGNMTKKQKTLLAIIGVIIFASLCWELWQNHQDMNPMKNIKPYKPTAGDAT